MILFENGRGRWTLYFGSGKIFNLQELGLLPPHHQLQTERRLHQGPLILAGGCRHIETPLGQDGLKVAATFYELFAIEGGSCLQVEGVDPLQ